MNSVSAERQCVCDQSGDRCEDEEDGADHQEERRADAERPGCHGGAYFIQHTRVSVSSHQNTHMSYLYMNISDGVVICVLNCT